MPPERAADCKEPRAPAGAARGAPCGARSAPAATLRPPLPPIPEANSLEKLVWRYAEDILEEGDEIELVDEMAAIAFDLVSETLIRAAPGVRQRAKGALRELDEISRRTRKITADAAKALADSLEAAD